MSKFTTSAIEFAPANEGEEIAAAALSLGFALQAADFPIPATLLKIRLSYPIWASNLPPDVTFGTTLHKTRSVS